MVRTILESIFKGVLAQRLVNSGRIRQSQHALRKGKACFPIPVQFFEHSTIRSDEKETVDIVYLRFQKAFNKVAHMRLVCKIKADRIEGSVLKWIEDWLTGKKQGAGNLRYFSEWQAVANGAEISARIPGIYNIY